MENQQLLALIRQKDEAAIQSIYLELADPCRKYIRKYGGSEADAHDVLQEAMYRFYRKVVQDESFQLPVKAESYVFGMIKNVWREKIKGKVKMQTYYDLDEEGSKIKDQLADEPEANTWEDPSDALVIRLLDQLGKNCKEILLAFYVHDTSLEEVAEEQGQSYNYLKVKRFRCAEQLRALYRKKSA